MQRQVPCPQLRSVNHHAEYLKTFEKMRRWVFAVRSVFSCELVKLAERILSPRKKLRTQETSTRDQPANHFLPCKRKIVTTADKNEILAEGSLRLSGAIKIQIRRLKIFLHSSWNWYSSHSNMFWIKFKHLGSMPVDEYCGLRIDNRPCCRFFAKLFDNNFN